MSLLGPANRPTTVLIAAIVAIVFGIATVFSGGSVLFGGGGARTAAGNYVGFVVWFNFLAGFCYIGAGIGLYYWRQWAIRLSALIAVATLLVFAAFGLHIVSGGGYEMRTVGAMILRSGVWIAIASVCGTTWKKQNR